MRNFLLICYHYIIVANYRPNLLSRFIHICLDLLFPRKCLGCGQDSLWLCDNCLNRLPPSETLTEGGILSVFDYNSPIVKKIIWQLKYKNGSDLAKSLAKPMFDLLIEELNEKMFCDSIGNFSAEIKIILIPVPLARARLRSRGYNQAEVIAKAIAQINPGLFSMRTDLVKKIKNTPTQVSIHGREARLKNLKNAFVLASFEKSFFVQRNGISQNWPANSIFIIIDDVSTTGATINEIRQLFIKVGIKPNRLYGLTVAHG